MCTKLPRWRRRDSTLPPFENERPVVRALRASLRGVASFAATGLVSTVLIAGARSPADFEIETCLSKAAILEKGEKLVGITSPDRLVIECGGERHRAVFKDVDEVRRGRTRFDSGRSEINFTDSYRYERAAYLLDRRLGIHRVPVAVVRKVEGREGALVQWIENASTEIEFGRRFSTQEIIDLADQKGTMHLFDALILNTDRRPENWLVGHEDLKLYLIDHSRAFRTQHELPEDFTRRPARLARGVYANLQDLDEATVTDLLGGLIDRVQIRAVLARRDLILRKISNDLEMHGADAILSD